MGDSLKGQRVLITQSKAFMGPALCECFENHGARVIADNTNPQDAPAFAAMAEAVVAQGPIDAVIANLALPSPQTRCHQVSDEEWRSVFAALVDPLPGIARGFFPSMIARKQGKLLVMGSATALRGQRNVSSYAAARGAQLAWVRAVGVEMAMHQVHVNLIAQNFVENPTYYPPEVQALEAFQERLKREVPLGRLATPQEDALFAVFLVSREVNFFAGQAFPFA
ncbi:MAG: SDR family oxidoreductase, partial [Betaproteobacteria bacterium]|nr:SDR family oxidoreductase [Betaproteobacteria bacterium]